MSSRADKMLTLYSISITVVLAFGLSSLIWVLPAQAAMDPRFELDSQSLGAPAASVTKTTTSKPVRHVPHARRKKGTVTGSAQGRIHVVKPGDNLFRILMRDYGLSNDEAETFIEEIRRENNIYDIKRLNIGQKITIPPVRRNADGSLNGIHPLLPNIATNRIAGQSFIMESPVPSLSEQEASVKFRQVWDRMLPPLKDGQEPIKLRSSTFSLTLDPQRYPTYSTMDNGRILVDQNASIPPLVKSLITEKDPSVRIVSESPINGKQFLSTMLGQAGFYSVEENFSMDFGFDPKLTIRSDFKVEKTPESIIKQDLVLMNSGRVPLPPVIGSFLKKEGFSVYEPFATLQSVAPEALHPLFQITTKSQPDIIDALLTAISVAPEKDRKIDVFAAENNGIFLSVKAERYFERGGQRHVVTRFHGDPVTYTLFRILETNGYQVTILEPQDDFRRITDKLLSRIGIQGTYAQHTMGHDLGVNYSLQMSGYKLEGPGIPDGGIFLTSLELDRVIRDLLTEKGYRITTK
jgi:hypothetical protein